MTQAGWYPDPAGQPQTYRYWDGSAWSPETTGDPYAPPPAPPGPPVPPATPPQGPPATPPPTVVVGGGTPYAPAPASGYGAVPPPSAGPPQPFGGYPPGPPAGGSRGSGVTILLVVAAVLVLIGLSVGGFFGYRALADDDDTGTAADDPSSATDGPTGATTSPAPTGTTAPTDATSATGGTTTTDQQCHGGLPTPTVVPRRNAARVSGGGLSMPIPDGYRPEPRIATAFTWADSFTPLYRVIEENADAQTSWYSIFGVGGLRRANGFDDPAQAAQVVMTCMIASPDQYSDVSGRQDLSSGEITVDGNDAYQLTTEIRVDNPDLSVEGDVAQVVVVDLGDPDMYGLYIAQVPIGDQDLIDLQESVVDQIRVD